MPAGIRVTVRLYGPLAESAGMESITLDLPPGSTVADALVAIRSRILLDPSIRPAVGLEYVPPSRPLAAGETIHLIPPVGGG
jgi:molybdopterin converting factor small subunit